MILLINTTDKIDLVTDAAVTVDVHVSAMDHTLSTDNVEGLKKNTAISTAATTDILAAPSSGVTRNMKTLNVRNRHATSSVGVTIRYNQNGTIFELHSVILKAGEVLEYIEGVGFFVVTSTPKLDIWRRTVSDIIYATAATFADITDLTVPLLSGKKYLFEANLFHISAVTTTGAFFGVNIGAAPTVLVLAAFEGTTNAVVTGIIALGSATARDTAVIAQTTGSASITLTILSGYIQPSADGTFAMRASAEVAANMTVKAGSWLHVRETDN